MNILLVDDEERILRVYEGMLRPCNYGLLKAADGETALRMLREKEVDMVLLDIKMPGISGLEVLKRIRDDERLKTLPVILVSTLAEREDTIAGLKAGADDYVSKPCDVEELLTRVNTQLKLSYLRRQLTEKEELEYVIHHIPDGLIVLNSECKIIRCNQPAKDLLGLAEEDVFLFDHLQKNFQFRYEGDLFRDLREKNLVFEIERAETKSERPLILDFGSNIIKNPAGEITHIILLFQDVTEKKRREFQTQDFLSLISHKLQTPMAILTGNIDLLRDGVMGPLSKGQADIVETSARKAWELAHSFEKLLGFVAISQQEKSSASDKIRLKEHMKELAQKMEKAEDVSGLSLQIHCPEDLEFATDEFAFSLILKNLLENAIKFNNKENKEISMEAGRSNSGIFIKVQDNGDGISGEDLEKIFNLFYQVDKHRTGNVPGYGLGLAIVQQLVKGLGGSIQVESEIGKGSTFILTLPVYRTACGPLNGGAV
jgi:PAS domain S-box-containing protein